MFISQSQQKKSHQNKCFQEKQGLTDAIVEGNETVHGIFCTGYGYSQSRQRCIDTPRNPGLDSFHLPIQRTDPLVIGLFYRL